MAPTKLYIVRYKNLNDKTKTVVSTRMPKKDAEEMARAVRRFGGSPQVLRADTPEQRKRYVR